MLKRASWNSLPLPPIPHLATMPWLERKPAKRMKIDTLLAPKFEFLSPAIANTTVDDSICRRLCAVPASTSALKASRHG